MTTQTVPRGGRSRKHGRQREGGRGMDKQTLEDYPNIQAEIRQLQAEPVRQQSRESRERLAVLQTQKQEIQDFLEGLPTSRERLVAGQIAEFGGPVPWKKIAAALGYTWSVDKARYVYKKICRAYFSEDAAEQGKEGVQ